MKEKWISSIMAGIFISLGAMTYLSIPNNLVGSLFFSTGIFLVMNLHNMLVTRVIPLMVYSGEYSWADVVIAWCGNGIGAAAAAGVVYCTRFNETIRDGIRRIGEIRLTLVRSSMSGCLLRHLCSADSNILLPICSIFPAMYLISEQIRWQLSEC